MRRWPRASEEGRERVILFNLSGHGHFDLAAYEAFIADRLEDDAYTPVEPAIEADRQPVPV